MAKRETKGRETLRGTPAQAEAVVVRNGQSYKLQLQARATAPSRGPMSWGISKENLQLHTANDVESHLVAEAAGAGEQHLVLRSRRADAFSSLYAARGLSPRCMVAAQNYLALWGESMGISDGAAPGPRGRPSPDAFMVSRLDAVGSLKHLHKTIGSSSSRLLRALVEPMFVHGAAESLARAAAARAPVAPAEPAAKRKKAKDAAPAEDKAPWRLVVEHVTGETNPMAQAARVRAACEDLADFAEVLWADRVAEAEVERILQAVVAGNDNAPATPAA